MTNEMKTRVETTLKNLKRNNMEAYYVDTKEQAQELVKTLISKGDTLSCGGSVTLKQTGISSPPPITTSLTAPPATPRSRLRRSTARPSAPTRSSQAPTP